MRRSKVHAVAVDPGFSKLGVVVVEVAPPGEMHRIALVNVWETEKSSKKRDVKAVDDDVRRARQIAASFQVLFSRWSPVLATMESKTVVPGRASATSKVSLAIGTFVAEVERAQLPFLQASPAEVRNRFAIGRGSSKDEVRACVRRHILGCELVEKEIPEKLREHAYDAAAAFLAVEDSDAFRAVRKAAR